MNNYLSFIITNITIMWKRLTEYKASFYSAFFEQLFFIPGYFLFVYVISYSFSEILNWAPLYIFLFVMLEDTLRTLAGVFAWKSDFLSDMIKKGTVNNLLFRPRGTLFKYYFTDLSPSSFTYVIINIPVIIGLMIYLDISYYTLFLLLILSLLITILYFSFYNFVYVFAFYLIDVEKTLITLFFRSNSLFIQYPSPFFTSFSNYKLFYIFPAFILGYVLIPIIMGKSNIDILELFLILIGIIVVLNIIINILWKQGIKKYEAYG